MKGYVLLLILIIFNFYSFSQSTGDYRSNVNPSGNWNASGSWQRYNGSIWADASDYPGQNTGTGTVTIRDGDAISLNVSPANAIGALTIGEGTSGSLTTNNNTVRTLTVSNNMIIEANGSFELRATALTVNGTTTVNGSLTDNNDNGSAILAGLVTVNSGGSISSANASPFTFRGGITNDGTCSLSGAGTIEFNTNSQTIGGTTQTITLGGIVTVTGVTVTNNIADLNLTNTGANSLTGTGTWTQGSGSGLNFSGGSMNITNVDFNTNNNSINYTLGGTQTIHSGTYRNLTVSTSGTKTLGGAVTVNGNLAVTTTSATTLACDIYQITGNATGTFTMASGTTTTLGNTGNATNVLFPTNFTSGNITLNSASTVTYQNSSTQTVSSTPAYGNLTIATGGTKTPNGNVTVAGSLAINAGIFDLGTAATTISISGNATITGTLSFNGTTTKTVTITGNLSGAGTTDMSGGSLLHNLTVSGTTVSFGTLTTTTVASTITLNASGDMDIPAATNYRSLVISGSGTKTAAGNITANNNLTIGSGTTFDAASRTIIVSGSSTINGTFYDSHNSGSISLQSVDLSGGTINGSITEDFAINGNLTVSTGNGILGQANVTVTGTTTISAGRSLTLNNNTGIKRFDGAITANGAGSFNSTAVTTAANLDLRGGITVASSSGSFAAGAATFNATQNITGAGPISFSTASTIAAAFTVTNTNTYGVTFDNTINGAAGTSVYAHGANGVTYYQPGVATAPMNTGVLDVSASGNTFHYSYAGAQNVKVPLTSYYNLAITGGGSSTKTLSGNTTVGGSLSVAASTTLEVTSFNMTVTGASNLAGSFSDNNTTGTNTFTGLVTISSTTGSLSTTFNSPFVFEGGITNHNTFNQSGTGAVSFTTNDQNIDGTATMSFAGAVTIGTGRTITYKNTNATGITLTGVLDGANAASTWKCDPNTVVNYQPGVVTQPMNTGLLDASGSGSTFNYGRAGAQTIKSPSAAYHNLVLGGGAVTKTLGGTITVNGNLTIGSNVTLDADVAQNYSLIVKGNFGSSGTFQPRNGTVTFNGTSNQTVTSNSSSFYNVVIDNSATQVSLNDNLTVSNLLTLSDGIITTGSSRVILTNTSYTSLGGYSSASFINGNLRRYLASNTDTYIFPIGNGTGVSNYFRADIVNNNLTGTSYIDSRFKNLTGHNDNEMNVADNWEYGSLSYSTINTAGIWELEPNSQPSGGTYDVKLYISNMAGFTDNNFGPLKRAVGSTSGADWSTGGGTLNNDNSPGRIVSSGYMQRNGLTSFSEFGGGGGSSGGAGLPIELISFTAVVNGDHVEVKWATVTEINNDFFTVERSKDAISFETLNVFEGAGNSSEMREYSTYDRAPFPGFSYYRLKQTDHNGSSSYSDIVSVYLETQKPTFSIFPNPVSGNILFVEVTTEEPRNEETLMVLFDSNGRELYSEVFEITNVQQSITLPGNIQSGLYVMLIKYSEKTETRRIVVE